MTTFLSEDAEVEIGMLADTVLEIRPKAAWIKEPTVFKDKDTGTLIVTWHYSDIDVTLEHAETVDAFGKVSAYAVQKIEEHVLGFRLKKRKKGQYT